MRRLLPLLAALSLVTLAAPFTAPAAAPRLTTIAHRCSSSGDACYAVQRRSGLYYLRLTLAAKYLPEYHLCLTNPRGLTVCRAYPVKKSGTEYGSLVRLADFPSTIPGVYHASWRSGWPLTTRLGPALRFNKK